MILQFCGFISFCYVTACKTNYTLGQKYRNPFRMIQIFGESRWNICSDPITCFGLMDPYVQNLCSTETAQRCLLRNCKLPQAVDLLSWLSEQRLRSGGRKSDLRLLFRRPICCTLTLIGAGCRCIARLALPLRVRKRWQ